MSSFINKKFSFWVGLLLALPFIYLGFFYFMPIIRLVILSLLRYEPAYGVKKFIGIKNYLDIFTDLNNIKVIFRTFLYTGICVFFSFSFGLLFAQYTITLNDTFSDKLSTTFRQIIILPMILIPAAAGVLWAFAYTEHYGWVNHILSGLGMKTFPWLVSNKAFYLVMLADIWGWTPFMYLILLAGLQSMNREPIEAAKVDGASPMQTFFLVILPILRPIISIALVIKILDTYRAFDYLWIMTKGGPGDLSTTLNIITYKTAFLNLKFGKASTYGVITLLFPLVFINIFLLLQRNKKGTD